MEYSSGWCLIESDPGVFSELLELYGVKGAEFEEVLDISSLKVTPDENIFGYIFLTKWSGKAPIEAATEGYCKELPAGLVFPKQVEENACGTIALLSLVLNCENLEIGQNLTQIRTFCREIPPTEQGYAIVENQSIRDTHNSFRSPEAFEIISNDEKAGDAFHFIAYVKYKGKVYELDGLRKHPICLGDSTTPFSQLVHDRIAAVIQSFQSNQNSASEIRFNLMALIPDKLLNIRQSIFKQCALLEQIRIKIMSIDAEVDETLFNIEIPEDMLIIEELPDELEKLQMSNANETMKLECLHKEEAEQLVKREQWRKENVLRRHNFIPFILCALRHSAQRKELKSLYLALREKRAGLYQRAG